MDCGKGNKMNNIELVEKYIDVFNWWRENKAQGVMVKYDTSWGEYTISVFNWNNPNAISHIVKNDKYVKFRIARADGVELQRYSVSRHAWIDMSNNWIFDGPVGNYRIKSVFSAIDKLSDNINGASEPVLCKGKISGKVFKITGYNKHSDFPFVCGDDDYYELRPLTCADLHPFQRKGYFSIDELDKLAREFCLADREVEFITFLKDKDGDK